MEKKWRKIKRYFENHSDFNSAIHLFGGIGIGILIARPVVGAHPIRWGFIFLAVAFLGHIYALTAKK